MHPPQRDSTYRTTIRKNIHMFEIDLFYVGSDFSFESWKEFCHFRDLVYLFLVVAETDFHFERFINPTLQETSAHTSESAKTS